MVNNMGPMTNRWMTSQERGEGGDLVPMIETHWERSVTYNIYDCRADPETQRHCSKQPRRIRCDTRSKATEQSNKLSKAGLWLSRAIKRSPMTHINAVSVE